MEIESKLCKLEKAIISQARHYLYQMKVHTREREETQVVESFVAMSGLIALLQKEKKVLSPTTGLQLSMIGEKAVKMLDAVPCDECNGNDTYCEVCRGVGYRWLLNNEKKARNYGDRS